MSRNQEDVLVRDRRTEDPVAATIAAYDAAIDRYLAASTPAVPALAVFLDRFAGLVGAGGSVLELGSGPGWDAAHLEGRGLRVSRSDATPAFVDHLRGSGHEVRLLDVRSDDLGGPHDGVLAQAVLLHLPREQMAAVLRRIRPAVVPGGVLGISLKEGDGVGWSDAKLGVPWFFTYWREAAVREVLEGAGWTDVTVEHVSGRADEWLPVTARPEVPEMGHAPVLRRRP